MLNKRYVNSQLERDVLRAILFNPDAVYAATRISEDPTFFADDRWTIIWRAMLELVASNRAIDPALIQSVVTTRGYMTSSQIQQVLEELLMASESDLHIEDWIDELFSFYQKRQLLDLSGRIEVEVDRGETGDKVIDIVARRISALTGIKQRLTIGETAGVVKEDVLKAYRTGIFRRGLMTPFPALNRFTNGFGKNWLIVIGADSGIGKTTMALQMVLNVLENTDERVGMVTLEMTPEALIERMACMLSMLDHEKVKQGNLTADEAQIFEAAMDQLAAFKDRFVMITNESFTGVPTAEKISSIIRVEHARQPLGLVVVDYFQQFAVGKVEERENACRVINMVTKQIALPIILLSQINRNYIRERRRPEYTDLRGTSQLQNDPDLIMLLDKVSKRVPRERWAMENIIENEIDVYIDKSRHGPTGEFKLIFDGEHYVFAEPSGSVSAAPTPDLAQMIMGTAP